MAGTCKECTFSFLSVVSLFFETHKNPASNTISSKRIRLQNKVTQAMVGVGESKSSWQESDKCSQAFVESNSKHV